MRPGTLACAVWIVGLLAVGGGAVAPSTAAGQTRAADTLPPMIPIFPLEDAMLFPNALRTFNIFEPRYRAMIADALKGDRIIGMATLKPGYEADYEGRPPIFSVGCAGVIAEAEELPDGRYTILLRGLRKFRVTSEDQSRPYRLARVEPIPEEQNISEETALRKQRQRLELLVTDLDPASAIPPEIPDEQVVNTLAQYVPLAPLQRQMLLELTGVLSRAQALIDLLDPKTTPPR